MDRWQKVWWYRRHGYTQSMTARQLKISRATVQHYLQKGIPAYDWKYDFDREISDDDLQSNRRKRRAKGTSKTADRLQDPPVVAIESRRRKPSV